MDTTQGPGLELSVTYYMTETALAFCLTKIYKKTDLWGQGTECGSREEREKW